jgi:hypothetical protein
MAERVRKRQEGGHGEDPKRNEVKFPPRGTVSKRERSEFKKYGAVGFNPYRFFQARD